MDKDDLKLIKNARDPDWFLRFLVAVIVAISSFVVGRLAGDATGTSSYPYGSASIGAMTMARTSRIPWPFIIVLAVLSFVAFFIGVGSVEPHFGVGSYYGAFSRRA